MIVVMLGCDMLSLLSSATALEGKHQRAGHRAVVAHPAVGAGRTLQNRKPQGRADNFHHNDVSHIFSKTATFPITEVKKVLQWPRRAEVPRHFHDLRVKHSR